MATLTPPSAAKSRETTTTMTTMATTIPSPATIESTGAARVLVPHGAKLPPLPPSPAADSTLSPLPSDPAPSANAPTHAPSNATNAPTYASFFVLGQGRRDDSADGIVVIVGSSGAHGDVHRGRRGSANDYGDTKLYLIFIYIYHYVDRATHAFGGPNHDDSVRVDAPTTTHTPQPSSTTC